MNKKTTITLMLLTALCLANISWAQKHCDLAIKIIAPEQGAVIPFGDTAIVQISIKNLGPDTLYAATDSLYYKLAGSPAEHEQWADLLPMDSVIYDFLYIINTEGEDITNDICAFLLPLSTTYVDSQAQNDTACVSFTLKGANTSIQQANQMSTADFKIAPNPAQNRITIKTKLTNPQSVSARMYDLSGRLLIRKDYGMLSGAVQKDLDISSLESGLYNIVFSIGSQQQSKLLIKY